MDQTTPNSNIPTTSEKVIYLHGFTRKELYALVDLIKKGVENPSEIAFCTSTANNLEMKVKQLVAEVRSDHNYVQEMKAQGKDPLKEPRPEDVQ